MLSFSIGSLLALPAVVLACADHHADRLSGMHLEKRSGGGDVNWTYDASYDWHKLSPSFETCQTGTQQSPIKLDLNGGLSYKHQPTFDFSTSSGKGGSKRGAMTVRGDFHNWGYGPAFTVKNAKSAPQMTFDDTTLSLQGLHVHSPADHSVGDDRSKAEMHLVWADDHGDPKAVTGIRIDPGQSQSKFAQQFTEGVAAKNQKWPKWDDVDTMIPGTLDFSMLLDSPNYFDEFWTYEGSLTSPPCTEGIRWFVARNIHFVSVAQMQEILSISTYSARMEQEVWLQGVNA